MTRTISATLLKDFTQSLLTAVGGPPEEAALVAESLVGANLRGHDSHGTMRLPQYVGFVERGEYRFGVELEILRESPALVICDGHWGFGQVQARRLLDRLAPKARSIGIAAGTIRDCGHIGRLGEYAEHAAALGLASFATVNNGGVAKRVAPPGGVAPLLGTNPFCAGVPTNDAEAPIIVDFSTSAVAEGKVRVHHINKRPVPEGWLLDHEGKPTTNPAVLYEPPLGTILPLGGAQSYKGFGLGLIMDLWAGGLSGGPCSHVNNTRNLGNNVFFLLMDPDQFMGRDHLLEQAAGLAEAAHATPRASSAAAVLLPGEPERLALQERSRNGIPFTEEQWAQLVAFAQKLGVAPPNVPAT